MNESGYNWWKLEPINQNIYLSVGQNIFLSQSWIFWNLVQSSTGEALGSIPSESHDLK